MELSQSGLSDYWEILFRPMPRQCQGKIKSGYKSPDKKQHPPLSLKKQIISMSKRHRRQLRPTSNENEKGHVEIAKESCLNFEQDAPVFID